MKYIFIINSIAGRGKYKKLLPNIDVGEYQKMVVQAYYDKIEYEKDPITGNDTTVVKSITPYKLGHEYVFYIKKKMFIKYLDNQFLDKGERSLYFEVYTKKQLLQAIEIIKSYGQ